MQASPADTAASINSTLSSRGAPYTEYSSKLVSWDDVSRGTVGDSLSCWGANITDTYLKTIDGDSLFTVRPDNWNEKLGVVRASDVALLTGNCDSRDPSVSQPELRPITLEQLLSKPAQYGAAYTGLSSDVSLAKPELDDKVSIRFQTVFLPLPAAKPGNRAEQSSSPPRVQFAAEAYNYNTMSDSDPRNLIVLASSQGLAIQADGAGAKKLQHHARDKPEGAARKFWLEAEATRHAIGQAQTETAEERAVAKARGKATSETVGIRAMGTRFNALLTVQIPLAQQQLKHRLNYPLSVPKQVFGGGGMIELAYCSLPPTAMAPPPPGSVQYGSFGTPGMAVLDSSDKSMQQDMQKSAVNFLSYTEGGLQRSRKMSRGRGSAARVSRGDSAGVVKDLPVKKPVRHSSEHVTVTVVLYHCVEGGVPEEADVVAAIEELERFYAACTESGRLNEAAFEFMTEPLTVQDVHDIYEKVNKQPHAQP